MTIISAELTPWYGHLPAKRQAATGSHHKRQGFYLQLTTNTGLTGLGEVSPLGQFSDESFSEVRASLADLVLQLRLQPLPLDLDVFLKTFPHLPASARHGVGQAIFELLDQLGQCPLSFRDGQLATSHRLIESPEEVEAAQIEGALPLKIKVGFESIEGEYRRLSAIRQAAKIGTKLRLDAGGAWTLPQAKKHLEALAELGIQLVEDPIDTANLEGMSTICTWGLTQVAADAGCRNIHQLKDIIAAGAAQVVVLKPMFIGSYAEVLEMGELAHKHGLTIMITTSLDSPVAQKHAQILARIMGQTGPVLCGLNTVSLPQTPVTSTLTVPNPLQSSALARPQHLAIQQENQQMTWAELRDKASTIAASLKSLGFDHKSTLALMGSASLSWVSALHAVGWLGATALPLDPKASVESLESTLKAHDVAALIDTDNKSTNFSGLTLSMAQLEGTKKLAERPWPLEENRLLISTSGSTGPASSVKLNSHQLLFNTMGSAIRLGHQLEDRWLCSLPLNHVGGLSILWRTALLGTTAVLAHPFKADRVNKLIDTGRITQTSLVPEMLSRVLKRRGTRPFPKSLRYVLLGGAKAPQNLLDKAKTLGAIVCQTWGMTETASQVCTTLPGSQQISGQVGPPLAFARVVDTQGGLAIEGPICKENHHQSKDSGNLDGPQLIIRGRLDRIIISGGENINPQEIEAHLKEHPQICESSVFATASPRWGQRPWAAVVPIDKKGPPTAKQLGLWLAKRLPKFKVPDGFLILENLPKNEMGKVQRAQLQQLAAGHSLKFSVEHNAQSLQSQESEALRVSDPDPLKKEGPMTKVFV